jgi:hypothetical protein
MQQLTLFATLRLSVRTTSSTTGAITLNLPTGVTYSSASTVFLTNQGSSAAPEPGTLLLLGLGMAGIGLARRKGIAS